MKTPRICEHAGPPKKTLRCASPDLLAAGLRFPWLFTNLAGSLVSGLILWWFRFTIQEVVAVVIFIPVIAAMGGNLGLQSSTLIIRGLATGHVEHSDIWKVVFRELRIGLLLGVICGTLLFLTGWMWQGNGYRIGGWWGLTDYVSYFVEYGHGDPVTLTKVSR